jgi:hypothetical protein
MKTTILLPYVPGMLNPKTAEWASMYNVTYAELNPNDDEAYFRLLAEHWRQPGNLVVVEQDILPRPGVVEQLAYCRYAWCCSAYAVAQGSMLNVGLGLASFSARMKRHWPGLMDRVGYIDDDGAPVKTWRRLDTRVSRVLHELGYRPHVHGTADHLHDYSR